MLLSWIATCPDRDMTRSYHITSYHTLVILFFYHSAGDRCNLLQGHWPKNKKTLIAPVCTLLQLHRQLEAPCSCGQRELCTTQNLCILSWSYRHLEAPCSHGQRKLRTHCLCTPPWKLSIAVDKGSFAPPTITMWNLPQSLIFMEFLMVERAERHVIWGAAEDFRFL